MIKRTVARRAERGKNSARPASFNDSAKDPTVEVVMTNNFSEQDILAAELEESLESLREVIKKSEGVVSKLAAVFDDNSDSASR